MGIIRTHIFFVLLFRCNVPMQVPCAIAVQVRALPCHGAEICTNMRHSICARRHPAGHSACKRCHVKVHPRSNGPLHSTKELKKIRPARLTNKTRLPSCKQLPQPSLVTAARTSACTISCMSTAMADSGSVDRRDAALGQKLAVPMRGWLVVLSWRQYVAQATELLHVLSAAVTYR